MAGLTLLVRVVLVVSLVVILASIPAEVRWFISQWKELFSEQEDDANDKAIIGNKSA